MQNAECSMQNGHPYPVTQAYIRRPIHCWGYWVGIFFAECRLQHAECRMQNDHPYPVTQAKKSYTLLGLLVILLEQVSPARAGLQGKPQIPSKARSCTCRTLLDHAKHKNPDTLLGLLGRDIYLQHAECRMIIPTQ